MKNERELKLISTGLIFRGLSAYFTVLSCFKFIECNYQIKHNVFYENRKDLTTFLESFTYYDDYACLYKEMSPDTLR